MPRSHTDRIREQFTRQADAYARMRQTTDESTLNALVGLTAADASHHVLDVACGPGFLTLAFARAGARAVGLDATDALLDLARAEAERGGIRNVEFRPGDAESVPYADATFDVASCRAAFHHFEHPGRVLSEMKRVTKAGGRLLVADVLSDPDPVKAEYHNRIERLCDPTHVRALPEREFDELFRAAGVQVLLRPKIAIDYDVDEWLAHGGPAPDATKQILALLEASLANDRSGLRVRRENGKLRFSHVAAAFLLRVPG